MEFKFKRKFTKFFITAVILHLIVIAFWVFFPDDILHNIKGKQTITILALINCELLLIFYLGLFRKKYFAYYDKLIIKRSFFKNIHIPYNNITKIKEKPNDSILFGFGNRPSFKISHKSPTGKNKKNIIRTDNNELLLKIIKNEIDISKTNNNNKKLTK